MHSAAIRRSSGLAVAIALCWGLGLSGASARADEDPGQVTSVIGDTRASDAQLAGGSSIGEKEHVATGEDGKCSMLVDDDIVVQLCERTKLVLRSDPEQGRRIIQVDAGSVHVIAAPRLAEERVEIHTPAAIAVLLGTIVHVAVDAATGDSTITSTESAVRVRSTSKRFDRETTLNPAQQITVRSGTPPPAKPLRLGRRQVVELTSCIEDLREAALEGKRSDLVDDTITRMAESEISRAGSLGHGRIAPAGQTPLPDGPLPGEDPNNLENLCSPVECGDLHRGLRDQEQALVAQ
jgi:hypothetical protein